MAIFARDHVRMPDGISLAPEALWARLTRLYGLWGEKRSALQNVPNYNNFVSGTLTRKGT